MSERPLRICDVCYGIDDHPRHQVHHPVGAVPVDQGLVTAILSREDLDPDVRAALVADAVDTTTQLRHMDCCRTAGCYDGSCHAIAETGATELRGADLVAHLESGKVDHFTSGSDGA